MKRMMNWVALFLALPLCGQDLQRIYERGSYNWQIPAEATQAKAVIAQGNPKIDPAIRTLLIASATKSAGALEATAKSVGVPMQDNRVSIRLHAESAADARALRSAVEAEGGEVSGTFAEFLYADVPLASVEKFAESDRVYMVSAQSLYFPSGAVPNLGVLLQRKGISEGVASTNANRLHARGIRGKGVKIGLIDFGFVGYSRLQTAGRVPAPVEQKAFNKEQQMEVNTVHGAGCAEIIHDMAPEASLYLAAVNGTDGQIIAAAQWLVSQGVDVISFSGGGPAGPSDGRDPLSRFVDSVVTGASVLWVNAAGNEADSHWTGLAVDRNHNGFIEVGPDGQEYLIVQALSDDLRLVAKWDDWGPDPSRPSSTQDIDLLLYQYNASTQKFSYVGQSANPQQGHQAPMELLFAKVPKNAIFAVVLKATKVTRPVRIHVFNMAPVKMLPLSAERSMANPATSKEALSVGAVNVMTGKLEPFSSQGPTDDGRIKPDISAPDNNSSDSYASMGGHFPGTSAACPHVAGFSALVKQMHPALRGAALKEQVAKLTRPMGAQRPNSQFGFGYIDAETVPGGTSGDQPPTPGGGGDGGLNITLPPGWGATISTSKLDIIRDDGSPSARGLNPQVVTGKEVYYVGDGMKIGYKVNRSAYYVLLHRSSAGQYTLVSPRGGDDRKLTGGEKYNLPRGDETIRVTEPEGEEQFILLTSEKPVNLNEWSDDDRENVAVSTVRYQVKKR